MPRVGELKVPPPYLRCVRSPKGLAEPVVAIVKYSIMFSIVPVAAPTAPKLKPRILLDVALRPVPTLERSPKYDAPPSEENIIY